MSDELGHVSAFVPPSSCLSLTAGTNPLPIPPSSALDLNQRMRWFLETEEVRCDCCECIGVNHLFSVVDFHGRGW